MKATSGRVYLQHKNILEWDSSNLLTRQEERPAYCKLNFIICFPWLYMRYSQHWAAIIPYDVACWHLSLGAQRCDSLAKDAYEENSNLPFQHVPLLPHPDQSGTAFRAWNSNRESPPKEYFTFHYEMI